jgi:hypothetical protein
MMMNTPPIRDLFTTCHLMMHGVIEELPQGQTVLLPMEFLMLHILG